jgi:4-carboxymuconolactone decarboxylase
LTTVDLTDQQLALYRTIVDGPRQRDAGAFAVADQDGVLSGPYRAMLLSPAVGAALERVGVAVRYHASLPPAVRELAILLVATHCRCPVEWRAHEQLARQAGVPEQTIASLHTDSPALLDEPAEVGYAFVRQLLTTHRVADDVFARAVALWTRAGVFELVATVGYYQLIAGINNAFEVT